MENEPATNLVKHLSVIPHFDRMTQWNPGVVGEAQALPALVRQTAVEGDSAHRFTKARTTATTSS